MKCFDRILQGFSPGFALGTIKPLGTLDYIGILAGGLVGVGLGLYYLLAPAKVFRDSAQTSLKVLQSAWHRWFIRLVCLPFAIMPIAVIIRAMSAGSKIQDLAFTVVVLLPFLGLGMVGLLAPKILQDKLYRSAAKALQSRWFLLKYRIASWKIQMLAVLPAAC